MHLSKQKPLTCYVILLYSAVMIVSVEIDFNFQEKVHEGERRYSKLLKKAESYGECWQKAMSDLHIGCRRLTEDVQSRLALSFTNCFLKHTTGLDNPCPCSYDAPIASCLKNSTDRVFNTYTEFYTHTQSICHYLQHRQWQEEAAKIVFMLTESSAEVGVKLNELAKSQDQIQNLQHAFISDQQRLISYSQKLNVELQQSRHNARNVYTAFKLATDEHRHLLFEVFDRVKNLQNFVLGEFSGVYTIVYYIIVAVLIYIMTSIHRTAEARIWMILIITLSAGVERFLTSYSIEEIISMDPLETNALIYSRIWMCRKFASVACITVLIVCYYRYKDYNKINNQLLQEIQQQNLELQMFIKGINAIGTSPSILINSTKTPKIMSDSIPEKIAPSDISKNTALVAVTLLEDSTPKLKSQIKNARNKENVLSNPVSLASKNTVKMAPEEYKSSYLSSPGNMPKGSSPQLRSILSEIPSTNTPRYNLRSSRLNSPASP